MAQVLLFGCIGLAGFAAVRPPSGGPPALPLVMVGAVLIAAGGLVALRGVLDLGANVTPFPRPRATTTLVETGPYRYVRHPIYSGIVLAGVGWATSTGSPLALALTLILFALFDVKARREEAWLEEKLAAYAAYRERTRKFVPGLY